MDKPVITAAQIVATVQAVIAVLVSFAVNMTEAQQVAILALAGVLAAVLGFGDAHIRNGRTKLEAPPPQNITITSPITARELLHPPTQADLRDALDSDVTDPEGDEPRPEGAVGGKPGAEARRSRKIR